MKEASLVFLFGGFGCLFRYAISKFLAFGNSLPMATLVVNVLGSLILSFILFSSNKIQITPAMKVAITTGMMGGFTTFSTFSHQTISLLNSGQHILAGLNILLNIVLCLVASYLGFRLA